MLIIHAIRGKSMMSTTDGRKMSAHSMADRHIHTRSLKVVRRRRRDYVFIFSLHSIKTDERVHSTCNAQSSITCSMKWLLKMKTAMYKFPSLPRRTICVCRKICILRIVAESERSHAMNLKSEGIFRVGF